MAEITLDRRELLAPLFPDPDKFLFVTGLAGPARDVCALTRESDNVMTMGGAMGAAVIDGARRRAVCAERTGRLRHRRR